MTTLQNLGTVAALDRIDDWQSPAHETAPYWIPDEELPLSAEAGSLERWLDLNA